MAFLASENASSSSSSIPPSSTLGCKYEYDVFLSFRGPDTRITFTDHLYDGLKRVIDESKIAVVGLSKPYTSSSWCLTEPAKIVECTDEKKQTVLPVFHHVDPSDVRNQRGSVTEDFAKHDYRFKDKGTEVVEVPHLDSDWVDLAAMVPFHPVDQKDKGTQSPPSQSPYDRLSWARKEARWIGWLNLKPSQLLIIDWGLKTSPSQLLIIDLELMMSRKLESLPMMMDWGIKLPSQMRVMMLPSQMMNLESSSPCSSTKWKRLYLKIVESEIKEAESLPSELLAGPSERNKLYFFFWHAYVPIPLPPPPSKAVQDDRISNPKSLSPILQLKTGKYPDGMCCVQLGSILYFLGGEMNIDNPYIDEDVKKELKNVEPDVLPKVVYIFVVYIFDLAIDREVKDNDDLLTSTPMNYGKASPLAFVADEKIYVIGSTIRD